MVVGDDVVDLVECQGHHPRFAERVCAPAEAERVARAQEPELALWSLFAAKEAAYKVVAKLGPRPVFAHARFVVAEDLSWVEHEGRWLELRVETGDGFVHAVAWTDGPAPRSRVERLADVWTPPGLAARALLVNGVGLPGATVERVPVPGSWDGFAPPRLWKDGAPVELDVSLSHHGRFVACAWEG